MKTLAEVYKNSSDEVREILKNKFSDSELGIEIDENQIKSEILDLFRKNIKNIKFLDKNGNHINLPSKRFVIYNVNGNRLFDINYDEKNKHFYYSYHKVYRIFKSINGVSELKIKKILKDIVEEELNLGGVIPEIKSFLKVN